MTITIYESSSSIWAGERRGGPQVDAGGTTVFGQRSHVCVFPSSLRRVGVDHHVFIALRFPAHRLGRIRRYGIDYLPYSVTYSWYRNFSWRLRLARLALYPIGKIGAKRISISEREKRRGGSRAHRHGTPFVTAFLSLGFLGSIAISIASIRES